MATNRAPRLPGESRLASRLVEAIRAGAGADEVCQPSTGRHEFKYLMRSELCTEIESFVSPHLELDKYSQSRDKNSYTVRSVYYDSPAFTCYYEKYNGEKNRRKYRVRTYNDSAAVFLECKQRRGGTYTKRKVRLSDEALTALDERHGLDATISDPSDVLGQLLLRMDRWQYQPTALVVYDRIAYVYPGQQDTIRVTLDRNLRGLVFPELNEIREEAHLSPLLYGWTILEVKFNDIVPRFLDKMVARFELQRQACSKYGVCIALLLDRNPTKKEGINHVCVL